NIKQIGISEQQRRRSTVTNDTIDVEDAATEKRTGLSFVNVFRRKLSRLPTDVENLYTGIR
ncbi:unnamed protein product, partial [Rotaria sp. Silwood2]